MNASPRDYDAVVVGSGPNGLVGALRLAMTGRRVLVLEQAPTPGGGLRSEASTLPGFVHDSCATVHALAAASPAFQALDLERDGVVWRHPEVPAAHPFDDRAPALLHRSVDRTAAGLGADDRRWFRLTGQVTERIDDVAAAVMRPFSRPPSGSVGALAAFGAPGAMPASATARALRTVEARGLLAGLSAHAIQPLHRPGTTAFGTLLAGVAQAHGWPVAEGGSQSVADAMVRRLESLGGRVECGVDVDDLGMLDGCRLVLLDLAPGALVAIAGDRLPPRYAKSLGRFRHGPGAFKVDYALDGPIPWRDSELAAAGTVHLGGTFEEIAAAEAEVARGGHPERPFVLLVQAGVADPTRAPAGRTTVWAYCHVPNGSTVDMTGAIDAQIERFAPGFRDRVLARHVRGPLALEAHNPNYVGGDVGGGAADPIQLIKRPTLGRTPWRTPIPGLYLCSASTPPGGGVHGMGGWNATEAALADAAGRW